MTIIIGFILGFIAFVLLLLLCIAAVAHHCDGCGETLVRSAGSRWRCPKCGRIYIISVLGLGRMRQVAFGSQDNENMVKEDEREADRKKLMQAINGELAKDGLHIPTKED